MNIRKKRNIINFDESDFRSKCMKKQEIIVFIEIKKHYQVSFENRKSLIIIEMINAVEEFSFSLMIIIQRQDLMISWFDDNDDELSENTYVMFFESEFISYKIALKFLKHYIKNSNVDSNAEWKLMLMNNHESHIIFEFIAFANENHIRSFSLIFHLTHCMQSLNVKILSEWWFWNNQKKEKHFFEDVNSMY